MLLSSQAHGHLASLACGLGKGEIIPPPLAGAHATEDLCALRPPGIRTPSMSILLSPLIWSVAHAIAVPSSDVTLRIAQPHELSRVAALQLDIFAPMPEPPPLLPMFAALFEANQRSTRAGMLTRLTDELNNRVAKGSEILVAIPEGDEGARPSGELDATGQYIEPGPPYARAPPHPPRRSRGAICRA